MNGWTLLLTLACCLSAPASSYAQQPVERNGHERLAHVLELASAASSSDTERCDALGGFLPDASYDIRLRAASALYWKCDRQRVGSRFAKNLCQSIEAGNAEAGAYLLLGYAARAEAEPCLRRAYESGAKVKLAAASPKPVPASLAVTVAMARLGDQAAKEALVSRLRKPPAEIALFLLGALPDIEDPSALAAAVDLLADTREVPRFLTYGPRTVRDVALEALVARLALRVRFAVQPGTRYSETQVAEVRDAARTALGAR